MYAIVVIFNSLLITYIMYYYFVILINKVIIKNSICKEFISLNLQSICHRKRFEDAKGVIRSSLKSNRNRQLNGQNKKDKTDLSLVPLYWCVGAWEIWIHPTYTATMLSKREIVDHHMSVLSSFDLSMTDEEYDLPSLYRILKLHKCQY